MDAAASAEVKFAGDSKNWGEVTLQIESVGEKALYFVYTGKGEIDLKEFSF